MKASIKKFTLNTFAAVSVLAYVGFMNYAHAEVVTVKCEKLDRVYFTTSDSKEDMINISGVSGSIIKSVKRLDSNGIVMYYDVYAMENGETAQLIYTTDRNAPSFYADWYVQKSNNVKPVACTQLSGNI